jgi:hypothetical protein
MVKTSKWTQSIFKPMGQYLLPLPKLKRIGVPQAVAPPGLGSIIWSEMIQENVMVSNQRGIDKEIEMIFYY